MSQKLFLKIISAVYLLILLLAGHSVFAFSEQRKFIGQEYDAKTELNYLNARYYDAKRGQFVSQDPMFWNPTPELLADPQQLNSYSYARNNPIIYSDPTGKYAELITKKIIVGPFNIHGVHGFINITPQKGEDLSQYNKGNSGDGSHYTIGGYPNMSGMGFGNLQARINEKGDFNTSPSHYLKQDPLKVPEGMTIAQYDRRLLESGYALSKDSLGPYNPLGRPLTFSANSGNVATQVVINAGGTLPQTQNFYADPSNPKGLPYSAPGLGYSVNTLQFSLKYMADKIDYAKEKISKIPFLIDRSFSSVRGILK